MNKTFTINISGYGFIIDDDAYEMLDRYLSSVKEVCVKTGEVETAADIEQRIGEIFYENFTDGRIIGSGDVETVIGRIGSPDEIMDLEVSEEDSRQPVSSSPEAKERVVVPPVPSVSKRLYRDTRDEMLGGVCSGIACFMNIDPVWVRLVFVALCFLSLSTIGIVYILLWIIIPPARTPLDRMRMRGISTTVWNVGKVMTEDVVPSEFQDNLTPGKRMATTVADIAGRFAKVFMMIVVTLALIVSVSLLIALSVGFIGCTIALFATPFHQVTSLDWSPAKIKLTLGCVMGGILVVGVPVLIAAKALIGCLSGKSYPGGRNWRTSLWIAWGVGVAAAVSCGVILNLLMYP